MDLFKQKADYWDADACRKKLSAGIAQSILEKASLAPIMQVLDFGAGTGLITEQLAPFVAKITAVDISESILTKLRAKSSLRDKVDVLCHDITKQPLSVKFDLIVSAMALHHVQDTAQLIEQFAAHLKPGGKLALADLNTEDGTFHTPGTVGVYHHGFDRTALATLLANAGFTDIHFETAYSVENEHGLYPVFLVCAILQPVPLTSSPPSTAGLAAHRVS